jgi:hypothetical protein
MTAAPMASWSLVASPECDPGCEVPIDCDTIYQDFTTGVTLG